MVTITDIEIPADGFALSQTFATVSDATFEGEPAVAHGEGIVPLVWATTRDFERLEASFETDPTVIDASRLTDMEDGRLYRMRWAETVGTVSDRLLNGGTVLHADAEDGRWRMRVAFPDRETLSEGYAFGAENGIRIEIESIYEMDSRKNTLFGLTDNQHETLRVALERGYYDVPRGISLTDLAEEMGISHQALSERLRRGHRSLIGHVIRTDHAVRPPETSTLPEPTL